MEFLFDMLGLCVFFGIFVAMSMESKTCPVIEKTVQNQTSNVVRNQITVADGKD